MPVDPKGCALQGNRDERCSGRLPESDDIEGFAATSQRPQYRASDEQVEILERLLKVVPKNTKPAKPHRRRRKRQIPELV